MSGKKIETKRGERQRSGQGSLNWAGIAGAAMSWIAIVGLALLLAAGCDGDNGGGADAGSLAGTTWRLSAWSNGSLNPAPFTITADFDDSQISGTSAVNIYGGPYHVTGDGDFSVGDLNATEMAGSEQAMRAEAIYINLLQQARKFARTEMTLTLKDGGNQDILIFNAR
jgi:heat shock protein HslJ